MTREPRPGGDDSAEDFSAAQLEKVAATVLRALGAPTETAAVTARSLALANELGHDSHGVIRLLQYGDWIADGQITPAASPTIRSRRAATAVVDGHWGLGQPAAQLATRTAIELAAESGVGAVVVTNCNHIGRLGEYVEAMADAGCVGLAFCNSGPVVAPYGGTRRTFGTNPFAWAAPQSGAPALVLDFSTASVAEGKVKVALASGTQLADGQLIDRDGQPTREPADLYAGGALLPFGGHKGSGLAFMIEVVGGLLSGTGTAPMPDYSGGNGTVLLAISIAEFVDVAAFEASAASFADRVVTRSDGERDGGVLRPGELERRTLAQRRSAGIPVAHQTRADITRLAHRLGIDVARELGDFAVQLPSLKGPQSDVR